MEALNDPQFRDHLTRAFGAGKVADFPQPLLEAMWAFYKGAKADGYQEGFTQAKYQAEKLYAQKLRAKAYDEQYTYEERLYQEQIRREEEMRWRMMQERDKWGKPIKDDGGYGPNHR